MKVRMIVHLFISVLLTLIMMTLVIYIVNAYSFPSSIDDFKKIKLNVLWSYYEKNIRGNLFAGLIAVGGFLMTGKTFILITMKQNVFDDAEYKKNFEKHVKHHPDMKLYEPLIQLKEVLYISVYMTIIAALIQLSIGLIPHWSMALISIFFAIYSIVLVADSLNLIKKNLDYWLNDT